MQLVRRRFFGLSAIAAVGLVVVGFSLHRCRQSASRPVSDSQPSRATAPTVSGSSTSAVGPELAEFAANVHPGAASRDAAFSLFPSPLVQKSTPVAADAATRSRVSAQYGKLPLQFEANKGQTDKRVKFTSRGRGYTMFLTDKAEAVLCLNSPKKGVARSPRSLGGPRSISSSQLTGKRKAGRTETFPYNRKTKGGKDGNIPLQPPSVVRMKLVNANPTPTVTGGEELPGKVNYFLGNDPKKWRTNVSTCEKVEYASVYPGVDLVYYGNQGGKLEHDFIVAPGADPKQIAFSLNACSKDFNPSQPALGKEGMNSSLQAPQINSSGDLVIHTDAGDVEFHKPVAYQDTPAGRKEIPARYALLPLPQGEGRGEGVRFVVADYDESFPLIIDPVLSYSTYLGGSDQDAGYGIAVDGAGNAYVTGSTNSTNFPTANPLQANFGGSEDVFVAKLNASGSALVYSTYLG
ncbi:MAG: hypothetical protein CO095_08585, partial [Armatimonadetes bacterium CG_4_9_14_3_um_filter_58_7]